MEPREHQERPLVLVDENSTMEEINESMTRLQNAPLPPNYTVVRDSVRKNGNRLILIKWQQELKLRNLKGLCGGITRHGRDIFDLFPADNDSMMRRGMRRLYRPRDVKFVNFARLDAGQYAPQYMNKTIVAERYNIIFVSAGVAIYQYNS